MTTQRWASLPPLTAADIKVALARVDKLQLSPDGYLHFRRIRSGSTCRVTKERVGGFISLLWITGRRVRDVLLLDGQDLEVSGENSLAIRWTKDATPVEYPNDDYTREAMVAVLSLMRETAEGPLFPGRSRPYSVRGLNPLQARVSLTQALLWVKGVFPDWVPARIRLSGVARIYFEGCGSAGPVLGHTEGLRLIRERCGLHAMTVRGVGERFITKAYRHEMLRLKPPPVFVDVSE